MTTANRRFVVARVPAGALTADCFRLEEVPVPEPKEGETIVVSAAAGLHKLPAVDATSFAIMKRARIRLAFALDYHFAVVGSRLVA